MSDLIERQAVLEGLASIAKAKAKSDAQKSMMGRTMFFVEQLPSVSTEKTGRWIKRENEFGLFECSVCKDGYIDQPTCMGKPMFKFCPSCGAKMVVEE
jgi:rubrerythrin